MKQWKWLLILLVAVLLWAAGASAATVDSGTCGNNLEWTLSDSDVLTISGTGEMDDYTWDDLAPWYKHHNSILEIQIKKGVTGIGDRAFAACDNTKSLSLPEGLTRIGLLAFNCCSGLTEVTIPGSVSSIGGSAFSGCVALKNINVADTSKTYSSEDGVVFNKDKTEILCYPEGKSGRYIIPSGVTGIGSGAFSNCESLTDVVIPESVTVIGDWAFSYTGLVCVTLPWNITEIGEYTFYNCRNLRFIECFSQLSSIGDYAFDGCSRLTDVCFHDTADVWNAISSGSGNTPLTAAEFHDFNSGCGDCGDNVMWIWDEDNTLTFVGTGDIFDYESIFEIPWSMSYVNKIRIRDGVTGIGDIAFLNGYNLTEVSIPDSVTRIGNGAFAYCESLPSVTIPAGVTSIADDAFEFCNSLENVSVSNGNTSYTSVDGVLFDKSKTKIILCPAKKAGRYVIPDGVISIGNCAFVYCQSLTDIIIPDSVTGIGYVSFLGCNNLTDITIPAGVTTIPDNPFISCDRLQNINVSSSNPYFTSVDGVLFNKSKTVILSYPNGRAGTYTIPDGVVRIGNDAFYCCILTGVTIPDTVTVIGDFAFTICENLTSITIPDSVTSIGQYAFECDFLKYVKIPVSVKSIGMGAFSYCDRLTDVYYSGSSDQWAAIRIEADNDCLTGASIHFGFNRILRLPASLTAIDSEAFAGVSGFDAAFIPETVISIADDAFAAGIIIIAPADSYACTWADDHGVTVINP